MSDPAAQYFFSSHNFSCLSQKKKREQMTMHTMHLTLFSACGFNALPPSLCSLMTSVLVGFTTSGEEEAQITALNESVCLQTLQSPFPQQTE